MQIRGIRPALLLAGIAIAFAGAAGASETIIYSYDSLGRLIRVDRSGTVNSGANAHYRYDPADNRTNVTVNVASPPPSAAANQPSPANSNTALAVPRCGGTSLDLAAHDSAPEGEPPPTATGVAGAPASGTFASTAGDNLGARSNRTVALAAGTADPCY